MCLKEEYDLVVESTKVRGAGAVSPPQNSSDVHERTRPLPWKHEGGLRRRTWIPRVAWVILHRILCYLTLRHQRQFSQRYCRSFWLISHFHASVLLFLPLLLFREERSSLDAFRDAFQFKCERFHTFFRCCWLSIRSFASSSWFYFAFKHYSSYEYT